MSENDADVLFGDGADVPITVTVAGEEIAVRELSWAASMRLMPKLRGLLADLRALVGSDDEMPINAVDALLYDHPDAWIALCAAAADRPLEWVESLNDTDGDTLRSAAWAANAGFFSAARAVGSGGAGDARPVPLAELFADLVSAGFGPDHHAIANRLTWRQVRRYSEALQRRRAHAKADLIDGIAAALGSKDLPALIGRLRG